ncbi:hypothetical protein E1265_25085 [Streptomyces sp. 8K308]|uniref:Rab family GTPase n=1 Tax=Streptomyces sp. 8K308 TaxID=2530388 RepID=UPI001044DC71|nr:hypothetical protein [Streptomyces sp. 8K308]TDC18536.1 hypothetical protein E1265_25085 [Streptomyces sp. 8K308]
MTVICPYCLCPVAYDESRIHVRNAEARYEPWNPSAEPSELLRPEKLRRAFQRCDNGSGMEDHYLPVPYLTNGEPLTVVLVGSSASGKTHLLAAMIGEVLRGGLDRYGVTHQPLNLDWHQRFVRDRVQPLRDGRVLGRTATTSFAHFADGLLLTGRGRTRPVVFFDLAGEDLVGHGEAARFLAGVGAFVFVVDPLRALRLPELEVPRRHVGIPENDLGDEAFASVLARVPRDGAYLRALAAVVVNKSDLVRFEPAVRRWLLRPPPEVLTRDALREESRDVYAFLRRHGSGAWLQPFTDSARCTLHFVSATGGRERGAVFPPGVAPRRVLAPLLSLLAMSGLLEGPDPREVGL